MPKPIGRPVASITLAADERQKLELMASRAKSSQRDAERARIILAPRQDIARDALGVAGALGVERRGPLPQQHIVVGGECLAHRENSGLYVKAQPSH